METVQSLGLVYEIAKTPTKQTAGYVTPSSSPEPSLVDTWDKICEQTTLISDVNDTNWTPVKDFKIKIDLFTKETGHGVMRNSKYMDKSATSESPIAKRVAVKHGAVKNSPTVTVVELSDVE